MKNWDFFRELNCFLITVIWFLDVFLSCWFLLCTKVPPSFSSLMSFNIIGVLRSNLKGFYTTVTAENHMKLAFNLMSLETRMDNRDFSVYFMCRNRKISTELAEPVGFAFFFHVVAVKFARFWFHFFRLYRTTKIGGNLRALLHKNLLWVFILDLIWSFSIHFWFSLPSLLPLMHEGKESD